MFEIDDEIYYIDFAAIDKLLTLNNSSNEVNKETNTTIIYDGDGTVLSKEVRENETPRPKEMDMFRYNSIQQMIDIVLEQPLSEEEKEVLPNDLNKRDVSFKMAFNTLIMYGIINTYDKK